MLGCGGYVTRPLNDCLPLRAAPSIVGEGDCLNGGAPTSTPAPAGSDGQPPCPGVPSASPGPPLSACARVGIRELPSPWAVATTGVTGQPLVVACASRAFPIPLGRPVSGEPSQGRTRASSLSTSSAMAGNRQGVVRRRPERGEGASSRAAGRRANPPAGTATRAPTPRGGGPPRAMA